METALIILVIILAAIVIALYFGMQKKLDSLQAGKQNDQSFVMLQQQLTGIMQSVDAKLSEVHQANQAQFGRTTGIMQGVTEQAQKMLTDIHAQSQSAIAAVTEKLTKLDFIPLSAWWA